MITYLFTKMKIILFNIEIVLFCLTKHLIFLKILLALNKFNFIKKQIPRKAFYNLPNIYKKVNNSRFPFHYTKIYIKMNYYLLFK